MENQPATPVPTVLEPTMPPLPKSSGKSWRKIIIFILIIGALIFVGIWYLVIFKAPPKTLTTPPISTTSWKIQQGKAIGFQIQIPADWEAQPEVELIINKQNEKQYSDTFVYPAGQKIQNTEAQVTISKYPGTISAADQETATFQKDSGAIVSKVNVDGREATSVQFDHERDIYFAQGKSIYLIKFTTAKTTPFAKYSLTFNQILSTFKLL